MECKTEVTLETPASVKIENKRANNRFCFFKPKECWKIIENAKNQSYAQVKGLAEMNKKTKKTLRTARRNSSLFVALLRI